MGPKISEAIWNGIVTRILAKKSTAKEEGKKYALPAATVRGRVLQARRLMKKINANSNADPNADPTSTATQTPPTASNAIQRPPENALPTPQPNAEAPTQPTQAPPDGALERARAEAGIVASHPTQTPAASSPASLEAATRQAEADDKRLVVDTYHDAKKAAVELLSKRVGLRSGDPLLQELSEVRPLARTVLEANAGMIAPVIRGKLVGWPAVAGALVFDGVVTIMAFREVAIARGVNKNPAAADPPASSGTPAPAAAVPPGGVAA